MLTTCSLHRISLRSPNVINPLHFLQLIDEARNDLALQSTTANTTSNDHLDGEVTLPSPKLRSRKGQKRPNKHARADEETVGEECIDAPVKAQEAWKAGKQQIGRGHPNA